MSTYNMPGFRGTLKEFKQHKLHSGSKKGPIVTKRAQAIAIAFAEIRKLKKKKRIRNKSSLLK